MAVCPLCGERYYHARPDWVSCLRCSGAPRGARWLHIAHDRVRENAGEDELLEAAGFLVEDGEAEWTDEAG